MDIEVIVNDKTFKMIAGDSIDLGNEGLLVFYKEPEATAIRILQKEHAQKVNKVIDFVKNKYNVY